VPLAAQVFRPKLAAKTDHDLLLRAKSLAVQIIDGAPDEWNWWEDTDVVIEFPEFQEGLRGAVARRTGSMDKLSFLVGVMAGEFPKDWIIHLPKVREWKGQLPKDVVTRRMIQYYTARVCSELDVRTHAWDALGIGHWFLHLRGR
jgi:hypothetical protein